VTSACHRRWAALAHGPACGPAEPPRPTNRQQTYPTQPPYPTRDMANPTWGKPQPDQVTEHTEQLCPRRLYTTLR
jgi:hypothetical protein